jgi:predicted GNAT family acetyltransferase
MGLLDNALQAIKNQYQETKGNVGLLMSDPKQYMSGLNKDAAEYNRLSSLALQAERNAYRGLPVSQEQAAAKQYIDQQQQDMALGFVGAVGSSPRKLPLGDIGEITKFTKPLPKGELYREVGGNAFIDMSRGTSPMGNPVTYFAEVPEMALGQGQSKGIMYQVNSEGLKGRPNLDKPGLDTAYLSRAGEFTVTDNPANIVKSMQNVWVSPEAYKGLSKGQKVYLDRYLNDLQKSGVQVNRVDTLPNKLPQSSGLLSDPFNVIKRDASDSFGAGAERIRYVDPKSSGYIEVLSKPDNTASVMSLEVPEQFRGKKIGESLQARVLQDFPEMQGQVSSKAAAKTAYRLGRRPVGEPNATLDDVFKAIENNSSVNLVSPEMQKRFMK